MYKNDFALIVSTSWSQLMTLVCYDKRIGFRRENAA